MHDAFRIYVASERLVGKVFTMARPENIVGALTFNTRQFQGEI